MISTDSLRKKTGRQKKFLLMTCRSKIIVWKPSFHLEANNQLEAQYTQKLWVPYYVAMAHSTFKSSPEEEIFTGFQGCIVTMFGGHKK